MCGAGGTAGDHAFQALLLPETVKVSEAMRQLRLQRQQFAFVVDERGSIEGIVTMEDLVEEVVGEIYDETDRDVQAVGREPDGAMVLAGSFPVHDLPDLGIDIENLRAGDYTTVAGLVLARLGHIPTAAGEVVTVDGHTAEVTQVTGRAITQIRLRPLAPPSSDDTES
jgi:putative hemolysin